MQVFVVGLLLLLLVQAAVQYLAGRFVGVRVEALQIGYGGDAPLRRGIDIRKVPCWPFLRFADASRAARTTVIVLGVLSLYALPAVLASVLALGQRMPDGTLVVRRIRAESAAARAGIEMGDRIVRVDHEPPRSAFDLVQRARSNPHLHVEIERAGRSITVELRPEPDPLRPLGVVVDRQERPATAGEALQSGLRFPLMVANAAYANLSEVFVSRETSGILGPVGLSSAMASEAPSVTLTLLRLCAGGTSAVAAFLIPLQLLPVPGFALGDLLRVWRRRR